jgi:Tfp pilus assembly protein PilF
MIRRHGPFLLPICLGLLTSLGCNKWQCCLPQLIAPSHPASPSATPSAELNSNQSAQLCLQTAEALEKQGYAVEAIRQYESAREHDPNLKPVARRLAVLYDKQGDPQRAEAEYTRALQEQSGDAELLNDCGYFHYRHEHLQVAENWLRNAVTINPNLACAWINLGQVLVRQGKIDESYQAFARVLRPAEAYSNLGVLLAKQGRTVEARSALQQAISLDPGLEQPRAFLKALPASPSLLPPGITNTPPAKSNAPSVTPATLSTTVASQQPNPQVTSAKVEATHPAPALRAAPTKKEPTTPTLSTPVSVSPTPLPSSMSTTPMHTVQTTAKTTAAHAADASDLPTILHGPVRPLPVSTKPKAQPTKPTDEPKVGTQTVPAKEPPRILPSPPKADETPQMRTSGTEKTTSNLSSPPPPPPPPPAPLVPRALPSALLDQASPIIRASALVPAEESLHAVEPLRPTPASLKLLPVPAITRPLTPPLQKKPAPQATLTDCQGVCEQENSPQK